jgi:predicted MFS family arabinose efflux permease
VPLAFTQSLAVALACLLVAGGGWVATLTTLNVAMQLRSPEAILGRCMAIYQAVTFGGMAIGAYALGLVADMTGTSAAILGAAGFMAGALPLLRRFAPMPTREEGRVAA